MRTVLVILLVVAVGGLAVMHFAGKGDLPTSEQTSEAWKTASEGEYAVSRGMREGR